MSHSTVKTTKDQAMMFLGLLNEKKEEGHFEHKNVEGASYLWALNSPRVIIRVAVCFDGKWEISIDNTDAFTNEEAKPILDLYHKILSTDELVRPHEYGDRPAYVGLEHGVVSIGRWESEQKELRRIRDEKAK